MMIRQRISDLIDAEKPISEIINIVNCSRSTYFLVKKLKKEGKPLYLGHEGSKKRGRPRTTAT